MSAGSAAEPAAADSYLAWRQQVAELVVVVVVLLLLLLVVVVLLLLLLLPSSRGHLPNLAGARALSARHGAANVGDASRARAGRGGATADG